MTRELVPAFARILLRTSLGKKHLVRPLLRTEITQVVNRRAWYDATKLTTEVLSLYKVCFAHVSHICYIVIVAAFYSTSMPDHINCFIRFL